MTFDIIALILYGIVFLVWVRLALWAINGDTVIDVFLFTSLTYFGIAYFLGSYGAEIVLKLFLGVMALTTLTMRGLTLRELYHLKQTGKSKKIQKMTNNEVMPDNQTIKAIYGTLAGQMAYAIVWLYDEIEVMKDRMDSLEDEIKRLRDDMAKQFETIARPKKKQQERQQDIIERRKNVLKLMQQGNLTQPKIAEHLHCDLSTIEKDIRELRNEGLLPKK